MPVTFKNNYLRPAEATLFMPGQRPEGDFHSVNAVRYSIEKVSQNLVEVVARKGWDIPGINVEFDTYGYDESPLTVVRSISGGEPGKKWSVYYGRIEFSDGYRWNITTAAGTITTPQQQFTVCNDGSGLQLYRYAGSDWANDEDRFINDAKFRAKLDKEDKFYLKYKSEHYMSGAYGDMVPDNDNGREYDPDPSKGEITRISKEKMFERATKFLSKVVADIEVTNPDHEVDPKARFKELSKVEILPVPDNMPTLIVTAKSSHSGSGILVTGGSYGFSKEPYHSINGLIGGNDPKLSDQRIHKVKLTKANNVLVADEAVFHSSRNAFFEAAKKHGRESLTNDEVTEIKKDFNDTKVPLHEYDGSYKTPVYIIKRPLTDKEAEDITDAVRKPNEKDKYNPHLNFTSVLAL